MAKNDYILATMVESGLYHVDSNGFVWTCKKRGGPGAVYADRWRRCECYAGPRGRPQIRHNGVMVYASRLAWFWWYGCIDEREVDHKNNDVKDNRQDNLQLLDRLANQRKAERDGLCVGARFPSDARKQAMRAWWDQPGRKEKMRESARRGWKKRKETVRS